jgi:hypothetical protein
MSRLAITKSDGTLRSIEDIENDPVFTTLPDDVKARWADLRSAMKKNDEAAAALATACARETAAKVARNAAENALNESRGNVSEIDVIKNHILSERIREGRI